MDYDFSGMCADQLDDLSKKLESFGKSIIKQYKLGLNVINNVNELEHRGETIQEIEDELRDVHHKATIFYTESMNKIQKSLAKYL